MDEPIHSLMFLGMLSLYFFMKYLKTFRKAIFGIDLLFVCDVILHELQLHPIYCPIPDLMVLSSK